MSGPDQLEILRQYAAAQLGTRDAIARTGLQDYADLIVALVQHDLPLPKPADTPRHREHEARARSILQPLLRRAG
jgi:hypothetical protein